MGVGQGWGGNDEFCFGHAELGSSGRHQSQAARGQLGISSGPLRERSGFEIQI